MTFNPDHSIPPPPQPWWRRALARLPRFGGGSAAIAGPRPRRRWILWAVLVVLALYYPVGMLWLHKIDDNPDFAPPSGAPGESRAVAVAAALVTREVDINRWIASDPFFMPGSALDNMPNYQTGIVTAVARFTVEMTDQLGRMRGSSQIDPDLDKAGGLLRYPGDRWVWDPSNSFLPQVPSTQQYRAGRDALVAYNKRLAAGQAVFERRSDNLQALLDRMAADIGSASAIVDRHIIEHGGDLLDFQADNIYYANKGRLYAYYLILRELGVDFQAVLREREAVNLWQQMVDTFRSAATLQPWVVVNGRPDSQFLPSHVAAQGFYLLRARTQLREVRDVLLK